MDGVTIVTSLRHTARDMLKTPRPSSIRMGHENLVYLALNQQHRSNIEDIPFRKLLIKGQWAQTLSILNSRDSLSKVKSQFL
jgi:hypothetical protein